MKKSKIFKGIILSAIICIASISCHKDKEEIKVPVTSVKLNKHEISLTVGSKEALLPTIMPANATNKKVTWKSKDANVANVDAVGFVTGVAEGTTVVVVTTADHGKTDSCTVTITAKQIPVTGVSVAPQSAKLDAGKTVQINATVMPDNATNKKVTWKSDKTDIATVDENGLVTGVAAGTTIITATTEDGGKTATCEITVEAASI
ncbi:MAG: Ig-like domain-containing protein [Prevotellaceae bacterium]|jgi:uncharacterized protein YjdB|nr:Ig-like domain-containing protein [Prevotellaceae bacterium]